jgi:hypothetical protein
MSEPDSGTWDLSDNDTAALQAVMRAYEANSLIVAELAKDRGRLEWLMEGLFGDNTDAFMVRLAGALMLNLAGREAIDAAMKGMK